MEKSCCVCINDNCFSAILVVVSEDFTISFEKTILRCHITSDCYASISGNVLWRTGELSGVYWKICSGGKSHMYSQGSPASQRGLYMCLNVISFFLTLEFIMKMLVCFPFEFASFQ